MIMWGEKDPWISLARGKALAKRMPGAEFRSFPGLGHLPQLEAASELAPALLAFLKPSAA